MVEMVETEQLRADLRAIKENVARWGWLQRRAGVPDGPRCVMGAANDVIGSDGVYWCVDFDSALNKRRDALHDYLIGFVAERYVHEWNDAPGRTVQDVFDLIDAALSALPVVERPVVPAVA